MSVEAEVVRESFAKSTMTHIHMNDIRSSLFVSMGDSPIYFDTPKSQPSIYVELKLLQLHMEVVAARDSRFASLMP